MKRIILLLTLVSIAFLINATVITGWDFEAQSLTPSTGSGSLNLIGSLVQNAYATGYNSSSFALVTTTFPAQGTNNQTAGIYFETSTAGFNTISLSWAIRHSNTSPSRAVLLYTLDRTASVPVWQQAGIYTTSAGDAWFAGSFDGSGISDLNNNPNVAFKLVAAFANEANTQYVASSSGSSYATSGKWRFDSINLEGTALIPHLDIIASLLPFYALVGAISSLQTYQVSGINLTSDLVITAPDYFQVCLSGTGNFANQLTIMPRSGIVDKSIDIRFMPTIAGEQNANIQHSGGGLSVQNLAVYGSTILPEPTNYPTGFLASNVTYYQLILNWTDATGSIQPYGYLIKGSKISADSIAYPIDGVSEADKKLTKNVLQGIQTQLIFELNELAPYYFKIFPFTNTGTSINYKTDGVIPLVSVVTATGPIGSVLIPGDIAFVEYASDSPDRFAFVLLKDVLENTKISFTDKAWTGSTFADGEDIYYWRGVAREYLKGEVIHIEEGVLYSDEGIYNPDFTGFSNSGDQILAFQGEDTSPVFIAGFSITGWITTGIPTNNSSYLPFELTLGINALGFSTEIDNGVYNGITESSKELLLCNINNPVNWTRNNSLTGLIYPEWQFQVIDLLATPQIFITRINSDIIRISWDLVPHAIYYKVYVTANPNGSFPAEWDVLSDNVTGLFYDVTVPSGVNTEFFYKVQAEL